MVRHSFLFLIIAIIALLVSFSESLVTGFATSVVPGWHTTIYPPFFVVSVLQISWICLLPLFYFMLEKRNRKISSSAFLFHLFSTLTFFVSLTGIAGFLDAYVIKMAAFLPLIIFTVGQCWFLFSALKVAKT